MCQMGLFMETISHQLATKNMGLQDLEHFAMRIESLHKISMTRGDSLGSCSSLPQHSDQYARYQ